MVDINKLRELNAVLQEGLISQEEYDKIKANLMINKLDSTKANSPNLLTDRLNNNISAHTVPTNELQHIVINNNNNNNSKGRLNNNSSVHTKLTDLITSIIVTARTFSSGLDQSIKAEKSKKVNKFQRNLVLTVIAGVSVIHAVNSQQSTLATTSFEPTPITTATYKPVTE
jgi:hypothetical protein